MRTPDRAARRVNLRDYILGRRVTLLSPHSKDEVARRIKEATPFGLSPFTHGVSGWVWSGWVRLAWNIPMFGNGFRPIFSGRLREDQKGTTLTASYGAPWFLRLFLAFWYLVLSLITAVGLTLGFDNQDGGEGVWLAWIVLPLLLLAPLAFHFIANRNANTHFDAMLEHLSEAADLAPDTDSKRSGLKAG